MTPGSSSAKGTSSPLNSETQPSEMSALGDQGEEHQLSAGMAVWCQHAGPLHSSTAPRTPSSIPCRHTEHPLLKFFFCLFCFLIYLVPSIFESMLILKRGCCWKLAHIHTFKDSSVFTMSLSFTLFQIQFVLPIAKLCFKIFTQKTYIFHF